MTINLANWRQAKQRRIIKKFLASTIMLAFVLMATYAVLFMQTKQRANQLMLANQLLQSTIRSLHSNQTNVSSLQQLTQMQSLLKLINANQKHQFDIAHLMQFLFEQLSNTVIISMHINHKQAQIRMQASSRAQLLHVANTLAQMHFLKDPQIQRIAQEHDTTQATLEGTLNA